MTKPHRIPLSSRRIEISLLANRAVLSRHGADWLAAEFGGDKTSFCRSGLAEGRAHAVLTDRRAPGSTSRKFVVAENALYVIPWAIHYPEDLRLED